VKRSVTVGASGERINVIMELCSNSEVGRIKKGRVDAREGGGTEV
jgi:hypothetical protein